MNLAKLVVHSNIARVWHISDEYNYSCLNLPSFDPLHINCYWTIISSNSSYLSLRIAVIWYGKKVHSSLPAYIRAERFDRYGVFAISSRLPQMFINLCHYIGECSICARTQAYPSLTFAWGEIPVIQNFLKWPCLHWVNRQEFKSHFWAFTMSLLHLYYRWFCHRHL